MDESERTWATYTVANSDRRLTKAIKARVRSKITTAFNTPGSALGKYVHALTAQHWSQLGIPQPAPLPAPAPTSVFAPIVVTTPTPMNTDQTTGVRRGRDPTSSPTSQPLRKVVRVSNVSHVQLHRNPFHLLQHPDEAPTLPATQPDSDYGADWDADADSDAADRYDNNAAICAYEVGPLPSTCVSRRAGSYRMICT